MSIGSGMQTGTPYDGTFSTVIGRRWGHEGVSLDEKEAANNKLRNCEN